VPVLRGASDSRDEQRRALNDRWAREEVRRMDADRHIFDAIADGRLKVIAPSIDQLLAKLEDVKLTSDEREFLRRAIARERSRSDEPYRIKPEDLIIWATPLRNVFPDFVLFDEGMSLADVTQSMPKPDKRADWNPTKRRRVEAIEATGISIKKLCEQVGVYGEFYDWAKDKLAPGKTRDRLDNLESSLRKAQEKAQEKALEKR
jgi:hypothetical protein